MAYSENLTSEILNLEKKYWKAMQEGDLDTALSLTDFPCLVAGNQGIVSVDKKQYAEMFKSGQEMVKSFSFDEGKVELRQVGPDTAVIAYPVHTTLTKNGESQEIDAIDTSTWIRRGDKWVCTMHTETVLH